MNSAMKQELENLSQELLGASSRWQTIARKGRVVVTKPATKESPAQYVIARPTEEQLLIELREQKRLRDEAIAEAALKDKVKNELEGSVG